MSLDVSFDSEAVPSLVGRHATDLKVYRVLKRAIDFIENRLTREISITEVGRAAAASVSTLERMFRAELGTSPSRYILHCRLQRVRKALIHARPDSASVASIALDNGFTHFGRFAGVYRRHFGELPSATLADTSTGSSRRSPGTLPKSG